MLNVISSVALQNPGLAQRFETIKSLPRKAVAAPAMAAQQARDTFTASSRHGHNYNQKYPLLLF